MDTPEHPEKSRSLRKRFYFGLAGVLLTLLALELLLHAAAWLSPRADAVLDRHAGLLIPDAELIHRPNPAYPGHDANGFRNEAARDRAFAVALGDSQTYGAMVPRGDAWPQQLDTVLGEPVYNMAFDGYGAGEAFALLDEALALEPTWILFGLYAGSDLFDAYELVYKTDSLDAFRSEDQEILDAIAKTESEGQIEAAFRKTYSLPAAIKQFFGDRSKLYGLARAMRNRMRGSAWQESEPEWATIALQQGMHPEWFLVRDEPTSTVLNAPYRLLALDRTDPRIREGERITFALLNAMAEQCESAGARFAVVALPTKELVYENKALSSSHGDTGEELEALWRNERAFWAACKAHCNSIGAPFIDTLEPLIQRLRDGGRPFRRDADGHLTAVGNEVVAQTVLNNLAEK